MKSKSTQNVEIKQPKSLLIAAIAIIAVVAIILVGKFALSSQAWVQSSVFETLDPLMQDFKENFDAEGYSWPSVKELKEMFYDVRVGYDGEAGTITVVYSDPRPLEYWSKANARIQAFKLSRRIYQQTDGEFDCTVLLFKNENKDTLFYRSHNGIWITKE